jgi:hypothetical protein
MLSEYAFLNDHSYSLRPNIDDDDELPLDRREDKRVPVNRAYTSMASANRTVSIDRSSSDKENTSLISSNSTSLPISTSATSVMNNNTGVASKIVRTRKKTARLSARSQSAKKHETKSPSSKVSVKSTRGVNKKKKTVIRGKPKPLGFHQTESSDAPSLSIEERVKLRRTMTPNNTGVSTTSVSNNKFDARRQLKALARTAGQSVQQDIKQIRGAMSSKPTLSTMKVKKHHMTKNQSTNLPSIKSQKLFLGSGLDLDNIVLGNRQRRGVPH